MDLIRDVLDKQLVDREERRMGKIDGLILEIEAGKPPRVAAIEQGAATLARRIHPRLVSWVEAIGARVYGKAPGGPERIPWEKVRDVGVDVEVDLAYEKSRLYAWQEWLCQKLVGRIPGGGK
jgi:sporulation protein YlmC with PRC-barrel domain